MEDEAIERSDNVVSIPAVKHWPFRRANLPHTSLAAGMALSSIDAGTSMLE
ncbi:hypothetical protein [Methylocystis bryophila]|uniref:hypothetical protein n=1 Tax=Methylocystis bryophila TaxID=655015 RepID=UPI001319C667|nr:hypothetical protein [Methylocystis bryophila]